MLSLSLTVWLAGAAAGHAQHAMQALTPTAGRPDVVDASFLTSRELRAEPPPPQPAGQTSRLPPWLAIHGSHRTRYESIGYRYTLTEVGSDQQLAFRTRVSVEATASRVWALAEVEDSRVVLDDSGSAVNASQAAGTRVLQAHIGGRWRDVAGSGIDLQAEAGRFSRDIGSRRLIARPNYRNVSPAFDGVIGRANGHAWSVQGLALRPRTYTYPGYRLDDRFREALLSGVYVATNRPRAVRVEAYALRHDDGDRAPVTSRRVFTMPGVRTLGQIGSENTVDYEVEIAGQRGRAGPDDHRAGFVHGELGFRWARRSWRPRVAVLYDLASGDRAPNDGRSGAFDPLFGVRRFELSPSGLYGLINRVNLRSPALVGNARLSPATDVTLHYRGVWLDQPTDRWRSVNVQDPTGQAGGFVGRQTELRLRQRWRQHLEFDGAVFYFQEGSFPKRLKPSPSGHTTFVYAGVEVRF